MSVVMMEAIDFNLPLSFFVFSIDSTEEKGDCSITPAIVESNSLGCRILLSLNRSEGSPGSLIPVAEGDVGSMLC
jgi:hypothetical protein